MTNIYNNTSFRTIQVITENGQILNILSSMVTIDEDGVLRINPYNDKIFIDGNTFLNMVIYIADGTPSFNSAFELAIEHYDSKYGSGRWEYGIPGTKLLEETDTWGIELSKDIDDDFGYYEGEVYDLFGIEQ